MGGHRQRYQQLIEDARDRWRRWVRRPGDRDGFPSYADGRLRLGDSGQATVEYAVVVTALLCIVVGLGALFQGLQSGLFVEHATASASHALFTVFGGLADVFSY